MSKDTKTHLKWIQPIANKVADSLAPHCERIEIAGSIRRQKELVGDIEIVAIPKMKLVKAAQLAQPSLFGEGLPEVPASYENLLCTRLDNLAGMSKISKGHAWGSKYRKCTFRTKNKNAGYSVDVFMCEPENFGNILWLRTGSDEFNHRIVNHINGSLMNLTHANGYLWDDGKKVECFEELDFFEAIKHPFVAPEMRY